MTTLVRKSDWHRAWLLLLVFYTMGASLGVRKFWEKFSRYIPSLAALAGRRRLPSPASLSRALDSVEWEFVRRESSWLLSGVSEIDVVLCHPVMQTYDACGDGWHVFDLDPTATTLRQNTGSPAKARVPPPERVSR